MGDTLRIEYVPLSQVQRWTRNPKKHDIGAIVQSITRYGFVDPPKFDPALNGGEGGLVYGNGRDEALAWMKAQGHQVPRGVREEGDEWLVPIKYGVDAPSLAEAEALAIDHNNLTMSGGDFTGFDMARAWEADYTDVLASLAAQSALPITVDADDLAALLAGVIEEGAGGDDFDTTPADGPTRTNVGDLWSIGDKHRLLVGDCTDPAVVARLMGGERAALCFTSPPYTDQRDYDKKSDLSPQHLAQFITAAGDYCELYAVNLGMSRKDNEIVTYWDAYITSAHDAGLKLLSWNVWDRSGSGYTIGQATAMFAIEHEWIFVFGERRIELNRTILNKRGGTLAIGSRRERDGKTTHMSPVVLSHRQIGTITRIVAEKARDGATMDHPAVFPIDLPVSYFEACTDMGDYTYDPFLGSGTTLIAAHRTGRRCFGVEISPRYADVCLARAEAEGLTCARVDANVYAQFDT